MPTQTFTAASTTHTAKVRKNRVICIGGGGVSGAATGNPSNTGGAAGGQIAQSRRNLTPGTGYTVAVGQAVTGSTTSNSVAGADTTFNTTDVVAKGGAGSALVSANSAAGTGVAGSTTSGVGDTVRAGGSGGNGGGGGGGAGWTAAGSNGSGGTQGGGNTPGGAGGAGGTSSAGVTGTAPGGGSGGAHANNATDRAGGTSTRGECRIDWIPPCSLLLLGVG